MKTMTNAPRRRSLLPLLSQPSEGPHGSRSAMTCRFKCGNACDHPQPNTTDHATVASVIETAIRRRAVLQGGAVGAGALVVAGLAVSAAAKPAATTSRGTATRGLAAIATGDWTPIEPNRRDIVSVPEGYASRVVIAWGDPVVAGAPDFDPYAQTPQSAAKQFGYNNDYVGVLPLPSDGDAEGRTALLVTNHEYTDENLMFPTGAYTTAQIKKIAIQSHGLSVVKIEQVKSAHKGDWKRSNPTRSAYNRRITGTTPFLLDGPAVGDDRLKTTADPTGTTVLGTLNNCSGGTTPWGTVLSGEENFNSFFDKSGSLDPRYTTSYARYGISGSDSKGWSEVDPRFDLSTEPHEPFRFGWVVELDPTDPKSTPRKHTMLGRIKHEGANILISDSGKAVAYMGDDERGDYLYKFVSADSYVPGDKAHNLALLTKGTLYVARLTGDDPMAKNADGSFVPADGEYDGSGQWIPLTSDTQSFVDGFSVADVLINTRLAADSVAPTKMDRPEDVEPSQYNRKIYAALTNNSNRGSKFAVDEANPLAKSNVRSALGAPLTPAGGNRNGYIIELTEAGGDHTGTAFAWTLLLVCGDPAAPETYFSGYDKSKVSPISCPDNVTFDSQGNLWIATDGNVLGSNDGLFRCPVEGPERGHVQQFLTVPFGAETCGPLITTDDQSVWVAVQHPGETDGADFEHPSSTWPHTGDFPRPGVVVTYQEA
jgi:hypothetical protein